MFSLLHVVFSPARQSDNESMVAPNKVVAVFFVERHMSFLRHVIMSPWTEFGIGVVVFVTGVAEIVSEFQDVENQAIGGHHGVTLLGIFMAFRALSDVLQGAKRMQKGMMGEHEA